MTKARITESGSVRILEEKIETSYIKRGID
jgi:hypothetical protein